ncbi:MAG: hypothetical protein JXB06_11765 [Spirochaetales bacterium]|nr:hypothetical protein [Spirochaetales bacterium]
MSGLFQRALEIRNHNREGLEDEDFVMDESSGISKEDQQEIVREIEKVSAESRITVTPETMAVRAVKKGFVFPLLVNILFVLLLAGGGYALYYLFQRGESVLMEEGAALSSAEGRLIEELKKESEAALAAKNREINEILAQLQNIDKRRQELQAGMEDKIAAREAELRSVLEAELAAERERLRQQGVSEADISDRLQAMESEKGAQFQTELAAFKEQAEAERLRQEESLRALQEEYQQNLAQAEADRQRVREEAEAREAELRTQLEARTRQLEQATAEAREELSRLAAQQEKQALAAGQLTGFYSRVKRDLEAGNLDGALQDLDAIRRYLDDPSVATLPNIMQRREIELFVVDSISSQVRAQMQRAETDTTSLIASAQLLNDMKSRVIQGDALFREGDMAAAEVRYREALNLIPEISKAHAYFLDKVDETEQARRRTLRDFLQQAEAAFARGDYRGTLDSYTRALAYLPEDAATVEKMVSQVRRSGYELGLSQPQRQESSDAAEALAALRREVAAREAELQERDSEIAEKEAEIEARNTEIRDLQARLDEQIAALAAARSAARGAEPGAAATEPAAAGAESAALQQSIEEKNREIAALEEEIERLRSGAGEGASELDERVISLREQVRSLNDELQSKIALAETLQGEKRDLEEEIASLNGQIASLNDKVASLGDQVSSKDSRIQRMEADQAAMLSNLEEEIEKKIARLENVERRYTKLVNSYREYASQEDALLAAGGDDALVQSKLHLNAFLSASEDSFPGLWDRIKRYDEAFEKDGRASAAEDLSDILFELSVRDHSDSRELFLESEKARYRDVPQMVDLIDDLRVLVRE